MADPVGVHRYLHSSRGRAAVTLTLGPFLIGLDRSSDNPFRNYAVPSEGATPTRSDVAALIEVFRSRGRIPRLEYIPSAAPGVEQVLLTCGFVAEGRLPLMAASSGSIREIQSPGGVEILSPRSNADLVATAAAQNAAYGAGPATQEDAERLQRTIDGGGHVLLARSVDGGMAVAGGLCTAPLRGVCEIAAVGTVPSWRRRGIASALVSKLTREAIGSGCTLPFLMTEHEAERRLYARVGFAVIGDILHIRAGGSSS